MLRFLVRLTISGLIVAVTAFIWTTRSGPSFVQRVTTPEVSIAELTLNSAQYDGRLIEVVGMPVPHARFSALGLGGILLTDDSGHKIAVLVKSGIPPMPRREVRFIGVLKNVVDIGTFAVPVLISE